MIEFVGGFVSTWVIVVVFFYFVNRLYYWLTRKRPVQRSPFPPTVWPPYDQDEDE